MRRPASCSQPSLSPRFLNLRVCLGSSVRSSSSAPFTAPPATPPPGRAGAGAPAGGRPDARAAAGPSKRQRRRRRVGRWSWCWPRALRRPHPALYRPDGVGRRPDPAVHVDLAVCWSAGEEWGTRERERGARGARRFFFSRACARLHTHRSAFLNASATWVLVRGGSSAGCCDGRGIASLSGARAGRAWAGGESEREGPRAPNS